MVRRYAVTAAVCAALVCFIAASVPAQEAAAPKPAAQAAIDQRALDILKKMSDAITQAKTVQFQARSMVPIRSPGGLWIDLFGMSRVVMQAPDKLFAETGGDRAKHDFYYDGKTITMYSPDKNLYAVKEAAPTVDAMIEAAYREDGKSFPYADLLVADPYAVLTKGLKGATYVGQSTLVPLSGKGMIKTDHLAFINEGVEWQIWIGADDHLPRLVSATYLDDVREPSYTVELGDWKLNEPVDAATFVFTNATKAPKVEFRKPSFSVRTVAASAAGK